MAHAGGSAGTAEPELAGARPVVTVGHVIEAVTHRVQTQFADLLGDLPAQRPDVRCGALRRRARPARPL